MRAGNKPVILFGGSFDPPHRAHISLVEKAFFSLSPKKIILVPAYKAPFKNEHFSPFRHRKKMLKLLLAGSPAAKVSRVSDFENKRRKRVYTFQLVNDFSKKLKGGKIFFLMGSDSLNSFAEWKKPEKILAKASLLVGRRQGYEKAEKPAPGEKPVFLKGIFPDISSTELRKKLFSGDFSVLEPELGGYVRKHGLYNYRLTAGIKKLLSRKRFAHVCGTARLAFELALAHGLDPAAAAAAAMLHDSAKELPIKKQIALALRSGFSIKNRREVFKKAPGLIHQWAGAALAAERFGVKDGETLKAIAAHASAYENMSKLAKLMYVSDFAGYDRKFKESGETRKLAFKSLDGAYARTLGLKKARLKKENKWIYE
ncbi:MAG: nicotinate (nicotinamide) nucleotide adenylyltransferase [Elusimicrobia bacterium CG08_land_8_20_14_0_20_51_18]|nr:MAG: nicotinate (nicotinamide) nucleotide adenylyltransferase [Elusimicrobia bacterium CG08_land_8_20_14_0_20_51_18]